MFGRRPSLNVKKKKSRYRPKPIAMVPGQMHNRVIQIISKTPNMRSEPEIDLVLPWLRKKSSLLQNLDKSVILNIIKNCEYTSFDKDDVIIKQGDKGDRFYIILNGQVSVYIDAKKSGEDEGSAKDAPKRPPVKLSPPSKQSTPRKEDGDKTDRSADPGEKGPPEPKAPPAEPPAPNGVNVQQTAAPVEVKHKQKSTRAHYGKFIMVYESGQSFGELALINKDSIRNASIIADTSCHLLVIHKHLYNETLKAFQEGEYEDRKQFIEEHALFRYWSPRFKRLLEMSLVKETYTFNSPIVKQGDPVDGLKFIRRGRAQILVEPNRHGAQYPAMKPFRHTNDVYEIEMNRPRKEEKLPSGMSRVESVRQPHVLVRRKDGYAAAERLQFQRSIMLCAVEQGEIIGDIETVLGMDTYLQTAVCTTSTEVYCLTNKNYERLVLRKNSSLIGKLRDQVIAKLRGRTDTVQGSYIPLLKHVLFKLTEELQPTPRKPVPPLRGTKELPEREILFDHLMDVFVKNKAELVEPYVPGAIYYREIMREKADARNAQRQIRRARDKLRGERLRARRGSKPRTLVALRTALHQEQDAALEKEKKRIVTMVRKQEKSKLMLDFLAQEKDLQERVERMLDRKPQKSNVPTFPNVQTTGDVVSQSLDAGELRRTSGQKDGVPVASVSQSMSLKSNSQDIHRTVKTDNLPATAPSSDDKAPEAKRISKAINMPLEASDAQDKEQVGKEATVDLARKYESASDPGQPDTNPVTLEENEMPVTKAGSETNLEAVLVTEVGRASGSSFLPPVKDAADPAVTETPRPVRVPPSLKPLVEIDPEYRDWETSDKTLGFLEDRVKSFVVRNASAKSKSRVKLTQLRRFEAGDEEPEQPKPGGKVIVRRKQCYATNRNVTSDHKHVRHHMVPGIENYGKLKKARMLVHMCFDKSLDKRHKQAT